MFEIQLIYRMEQDFKCRTSGTQRIINRILFNQNIVPMALYREMKSRVVVEF